VLRQERHRRVGVPAPARREDLAMLVLRPASIVELREKETLIAVGRVVERADQGMEASAYDTGIKGVMKAPMRLPAAREIIHDVHLVEKGGGAVEIVVGQVGNRQFERQALGDKPKLVDLA
jgi:hypothetical protein